MRHKLRMKICMLLACLVGLSSCNTLIGAWRDTKALSKWGQNKIENSSSGGVDAPAEYEYGAPVY